MRLGFHGFIWSRRGSTRSFGQQGRGNRTDVNQINAYLERAREIIGERSPAEIDYDDAVVAHLGRGLSIKNAISAANRTYPSEALKPGPAHWDDLAARYHYLAEHKAILTKLGLKE